MLGAIIGGIAGRPYGPLAQKSVNAEEGFSLFWHPTSISLVCSRFTGAVPVASVVLDAYKAKSVKNIDAKVYEDLYGIASADFRENYTDF